MSAKTRHARTIGLFWTFASALWLLGSPPVSAQVRPASSPIVTSRLRHITEQIPGSNTDLPPYLAKPQDIYLLITAGASYTEVTALANPEVPPVTVANALASALAGTPLQGQTVKYSADRYSAAQVTRHSSRVGALFGTSTVPVGSLMTGLRRAGLTPHLLLRVPSYARTGALPRSRYGSRSFRWYDASRLGSRRSVTVTATLTRQTLAPLAACFLSVPILCLLGLGMAGFLSGRGDRSSEARRMLFRRVNSYTLMGAVAVQLYGVVTVLKTPAPAALADLWLGSSTSSGVVVALTLGMLALPLFLRLGRKVEMRRFGPAPTLSAFAIPMSDEEKAVRKKVAKYSMAPHLVGAVALGAVPFFVPRTSLLYPFIHPVAMFLPVIGAGLAARIFSKQLGRFTQKSLDDDLTWRARQLGQTLGVRMPDVFVEDSSRAAHLAFASHQGHHITLSRKLQATFAPAETDFVLAHHLACMKRRTGGDRRWAKSLLPLPMLLLVFLLSAPRYIPGAPSLTPFILSPWFLPGILVYAGLFVWLTIALAGGKGQVKQDLNADRDALEVTRDIAAASSALGKLEINPAIGSAASSAGTNPEMVRMAAMLQTGRLAARQAALQSAAQTLRFAPAPNSPADTNKDQESTPKYR